MKDTAWDLLAFPRLCALIAQQPTRLGQAMHNAGFRSLDLPFFYVACPVEDTAEAIHAMRKLGLRGLSLTIPHKENAFTLVDSLTPEAKRIGAINTVVNDGRALTGCNTDWIGVREALHEAGVDAAGSRVLVFGAGGAAKAAIFALEKIGAAEILLGNRSRERAEKIAASFPVKVVGLEDLPGIAAEDVALVINATPIGSPLGGTESPLGCFFKTTGKSPCLFEMVTQETELSRVAVRGGARVIPGARMLLFQALEQFRLFTEHEPSREVFEKALQEALQ